MSTLLEQDLPAPDAGAFDVDQDVTQDFSCGEEASPWLYKNSLQKAFTDNGGMTTTQPSAEYNQPRFNQLIDADFLIVPEPKEYESIYSDDSEDLFNNKPLSPHVSPLKMWAKLKEQVVVQKPSLFEIAKQAIDNNNTVDSELKNRVAVYLGMFKWCTVASTTSLSQHRTPSQHSCTPLVQFCFLNKDRVFSVN